MDEHQDPKIAFRGVHLTSLGFNVPQVPEGKLKCAPRFTVRASLSPDKAQLTLSMEVDLFGNLPPADKPAVDLTFELIGLFEKTSEGGMGLEEYAKSHAPASLVPYARELIANITTRSPLPTLNIGPINVIAAVEKGKADFVMTVEDRDSVSPSA